MNRIVFKKRDNIMDSDFCEVAHTIQLYRMRFRNDEKILPHLVEIGYILDDMEKKFREESKEIVEFWKGMLKKYWHVWIYEDTFDEEDVKEEFYMFPYLFNSLNDTVFALVTTFSENQYKGGIEDKYYDIFDNLNRNMVFEEIDEEQFRLGAHCTVDWIINYRLERIADCDDNEEKKRNPFGKFLWK